MAQRALRILERAVMLQVGSQGPPHYLKGDETIRDAQFPGDGANPRSQEVLAGMRHDLALALAPTKVGKINASGDASAVKRFHASRMGRTCSGTAIGVLLALDFSRPG
jgi:hypothetical protein